MSGVQVVHFQGVDWEKEKSKRERGSRQRKARSFRRRELKAFKKMEAAQVEQLKRFRRFLHSMLEDELRPLLTERFVTNFYGDGNYEQHVTRLLNELASDDILNNEIKRAALDLLKANFTVDGNYGAADDFLQMLFALQNMNEILDTKRRHFEAYLTIFFDLPDYEQNKERFLRRDLRVAQLVAIGNDNANRDDNANGIDNGNANGIDNAAALVLELKENLIRDPDIPIFGVEDGEDNSHGIASSGSSDRSEG